VEENLSGRSSIVISLPQPQDAGCCSVGAEAMRTWRSVVDAILGKRPEQELKSQTTPQPRVSAFAQSPRIWRGVAIISLVLSLGASFAIAARDIFLGEPILGHHTVNENNPFSQRFGISNRMSFSTMYNTCVVEITGGEILDPQFEFIGSEIHHRLGDIKPGNRTYMETPVVRAPGKPLYGSFTFFVRYSVNVFGGHWSRDFYVGTCKWNFEEKVILECAADENIPIKKLVSLKNSLERCN
jgi:hypothetical protein